MTNTKDFDRLIEKRWPTLKKRAQNERNAGKLITILEEIEDQLFLLEMRIAVHNGSTPARGAAASRSARGPDRWTGGPRDLEFKSQ
jgi:hypothetical protein